MTGAELQLAAEAGKKVSSFVPSLVQTGVGIGQLLKSRKLQRGLGDRPEMEIPDAAKEALAVARNLASSFYMPGQSQAEQALNQQYAGAAQNVMNTASSSAEALGALVNANANRMAAQTNLAGQAEQSYVNRQAMLQGELKNMGEWQFDEWMQNTWNPYAQKVSDIAAMKQAGATNLFEGFKSIAGMSASGGGMKTPEEMEALRKRVETEKAEKEKLEMIEKSKGFRFNAPETTEDLESPYSTKIKTPNAYQKQTFISTDGQGIIYNPQLKNLGMFRLNY